MDEDFKIGQPYDGPDGKKYIYLGGDPEMKASWRPLVPPATPGSDFARAMAQGATFGFADEMVGLAQGEEAGKASRARMEQIRRDRPGAAFLGETLGGAWLPGGAAATLGRSVLRSTGSRVAAGIIGGAVPAAAGGALTGAGEGEGGFNAEGVIDRGTGALIGGGVGATVGGVLGGGAAAAGRVASRVTGTPGDATDWARVQLINALEDSGLTPEQALVKLREMGPGAVVADLGLPAARKARASTNFAPGLVGEGGPFDRIGQRNAGVGERMANEMRESSGLPGNYHRSLEDAKKGVSQVRREGYQQFDQITEVDHPAVQRVLMDPQIRSIIAERNPAVAEGQALPSFRDLQRAMFRLDDHARRGQREGDFQLADEARELRQELVAAMEEALPPAQAGTFRQTQKAYAIASKTRDAHELGRKFANRPVGDIVNELRRLPPEARDGFRQGLLDDWETALRLRTGTGGRPGAILDAGPEIRDRLRVIMGTDPAFKRLIQSRDREWRWRRTFQAISGNSTSLQQAADMFTPDQIPLSKRDAFMRAVSWVTGFNAKEKRQAWEMIGRVLLSEGDEAAELLAKELSFRTPVAPIVGAVGGTAAAGQLVRKRAPSPMQQAANPTMPGLFQ